jgi:hypothetical protein
MVWIAASFSCTRDTCGRLSHGGGIVPRCRVVSGALGEFDASPGTSPERHSLGRGRVVVASVPVDHGDAHVTRGSRARDFGVIGHLATKNERPVIWRSNRCHDSTHGRTPPTGPGCSCRHGAGADQSARSGHRARLHCSLAFLR